MILITLICFCWIHPWFDFLNVLQRSDLIFLTAQGGAEAHGRPGFYCRIGTPTTVTWHGKPMAPFWPHYPHPWNEKQHLHQIGRGWPSPKGKDIVLQQNQFSRAFPVRFKGEYVLNDNFWKEKKLGGCDFWREMTHYSTASWGGDFF